MDDNVLLVAFTEPSQAYQALSRLRQAGDAGQVDVRSAALLERGPDGVVRVPEGDDAAPGVAVAGGGLIGMLVGVLSGPLGVLLGTPTGMVAGGVAAAAHADDQDIALTALAGQIAPGSTVLVAEVSEVTPDVIDKTMATLGGTVTRRSAADVYAEVQSARAAQEAAEAEARRVLRDQRRAEHKDQWEQFRNKVKSAVG